MSTLILDDKITLNIVDVDPQYEYYNLIISKDTLSKKWVGTGNNLAIRLEPNILEIYATVTENEKKITTLDSDDYEFSFYISGYNDLGVEYDETKEFKRLDYLEEFTYGSEDIPYLILKNNKYEFNSQIFYIDSKPVENSNLFKGIEKLSKSTYYQSLTDSEKEEYKKNLINLYTYLGGAFHSNASNFGLLLYKDKDTFIRGPYYINIQWDSTSAAAKLDINKYDITAAVDNSVMEFTGRGLSLYLPDDSTEDTGLTIYSGGTSETDRVFYANDEGDLVLYGDIYANNGYFNGTVNATDGTFNGTVNATDGTFNGAVYATYGSFSGTIEAKSGLIGGITIDNTSIYSENSANVGNKFNFLIDNKGIYANSLEIGNEAVIRDYLLLGDETGLYGKIYNPNRTQETDYKFIEVGNDLETIININSDATGNVGKIYFDGNNSKLWGDNDGLESWSITPDKVNFQNVTVQGIISTAVFEKQRIQLSGGTFLFKDGMYIEPFVFSLDDDTNYTDFLVNSSENFMVKVSEESNEYENFKSFQSSSIFKFLDSNSKLITNHLYVLTNTERSNFIYFRYRGEEKDSPYKFYDTNNGSYDLIIDLGKLEINEDESEISCNDYIIGINSTSQDYNSLGLNANALTVSRFEINDDKFSQGNIKTMILLGHLPMSLTGLDDDTYGLYAESVYLTGTLTTKYVDGQTKYAGVNTLNGAQFTKTWSGMTDDQSPIVFWAGSKDLTVHEIQQSPFQITSNGTLYANQGYFEGSILTNATIEASEIVTAKITGKDDQAALVIEDADMGIIFNGSDKEEKMELSNESLSLSIPLLSSSYISGNAFNSSMMRINNSGQTLYLLNNGIRFYDYDLYGSKLEDIQNIKNYYALNYNKDTNPQSLDFIYESNSTNKIMRISSSQIGMMQDVNVKKDLTFDSDEDVVVKYTINNSSNGIDIYINKI